MEENMHKGAEPYLFNYAKENRRLSTPAEKLLWHALRNKKLNGLKFRRQHPISDFVADFYCEKQKLAIELDGDYHNTRDQKEYDAGRTYELKELGIKVIRFKNEEVIEKLNFVLAAIKKHCEC